MALDCSAIQFRVKVVAGTKAWHQKFRTGGGAEVWLRKINEPEPDPEANFVKWYYSAMRRWNNTISGLSTVLC